MYSFRINHNISAINTYRQLTRSTATLERSLERLSSGLRINRAADDVAGLSISQRMRAQVVGLQQASRNASQAINLVQTAEGALNEIHDILTRMRELAVEAASDNISESDRASLHNEFDQLRSEITRIAESTEYNNVKLIDGSFTRNQVNWDATRTANSGTDLTSLGVQEITPSDIQNSDLFGGNQIINSTTQQAVDTSQYQVRYNFAFSDTASDGQLTLQLSSITIVDRSTGNTVDTLTYNSTDNKWEGTTYEVSGGSSQITSQTVIYYNAPDNGDTLTLNFDKLGVMVKLNDSYDDGDLDGMNVVVTGDGDKSFQVGADNATDNTIGFTLSGATAAALGLSDSDLTTLINARNAIDQVDSAIETINTQRSQLGAIQNRLNFTISNLDNIAQNIQASESTIRDADFAQEITNFTKSQILVQAGTAMLAQANTLPQNVLALLGR